MKNVIGKLKEIRLLLILTVLVSGLSSNWTQAFDCVMDLDGNGTGDGTSGASSNSSSARVACGNNATAGLSSTALGNSATATGSQSVALGRVTTASGSLSTAVGANAKARGNASTALGANTNIDAGSSSAIAIGKDAETMNALGGIAIGGDMDGDGTGAIATAAGAIAIGADVVADIANTMVVGVPVHVKRDDGTTQVKVNEKSAGNNVRTLFNVICDTCTPGFRFNQALPSNQSWNFRMLQSGAFSVDDPATPSKEAEFRSGGDFRIAGSLIEGSSREIKKNILEVDGNEILAKLDALPIHLWTYSHNPDRVRHMGPMAEDFHRIFELGENNKSISGVDTSGVALASIKELRKQNIQILQTLSAKDAELAQLKKENEGLNREMAAIKSQLAQVDELRQMLTALLVKSNISNTSRVVSN